MDKPRCDRHKNREERPIACHVCTRIAVEQELVETVASVLISAGKTLNIYEGDNEHRLTDYTSDLEVILKELMQCDEDLLEVQWVEWVEDFALKQATLVEKNGWVRFVYGNDGWDVICDYTMNLDDLLEPVCEYANTLGG